MAKTRPISVLFNLVVWLTGILVSLAVGLGMADGVLIARKLFIPLGVTIVAGWIVVILTVLSVILAIAERL